MTPTTLVLRPSALPSTSYHFLLLHLWKVYFPHGPQLTLVFWGKVRGQTIRLQSLEFRKKWGHDPKAVTTPETLGCSLAVHTCLSLPSAEAAPGRRTGPEPRPCRPSWETAALAHWVSGKWDRGAGRLRLSWTTMTHTPFNSAPKTQLTTNERAR